MEGSRGLRIKPTSLYFSPVVAVTLEDKWEKPSRWQQVYFQLNLMRYNKNMHPILRRAVEAILEMGSQGSPVITRATLQIGPGHIEERIRLQPPFPAWVLSHWRGMGISVPIHCPWFGQGCVDPVGQWWPAELVPLGSRADCFKCILKIMRGGVGHSRQCMKLAVEGLVV